jgi:hypothetical protein
MGIEMSTGVGENAEGDSLTRPRPNEDAETRARMKFGVEAPTFVAGMPYRVAFSNTDDVIHEAVEAEPRGHHDAAGNDHLGTQPYMLAEFETDSAATLES